MAKVTTQVRRALGVIQDGARPLWSLLAGHWMDVAFTTQMHYVSAFFSATRYWRDRQVRLVQGQWGDAVCMFLESWQFVRTNLTTWTHPSGDVLVFDSENGLRRGLHVLRERWRRHQFDLFLKLDRHEAREIAAADQAGYDADRVKRAVHLYKDVTTEARGVMLSGGKSEEYYSCMRWGKPPAGAHWCTTCSLCSASVLPSLAPCGVALQCLRRFPSGYCW